MLMEVTASAILSLGAVPTSGASDTAQFVASQVEQGRRHLQDSYAFGLRAKGYSANFIRLSKSVASLIGTVTERGQC